MLTYGNESAIIQTNKNSRLIGREEAYMCRIIFHSLFHKIKIKKEKYIGYTFHSNFRDSRLISVVPIFYDFLL